MHGYLILATLTGIVYLCQAQAFGDYESMIDPSVKATCHDIPSELTLCQGIEWDKMKLPNNIGQESMSEVVEQSNHWVLLVGVNCHPRTRQFLCTMYAPLCIPFQPDMKLEPCRNFCESVRDSCLPVMRRYNFSWPSFLQCDKFIDDGLCMPLVEQKASTVEPGRRICKECADPKTKEAVVDMYCQSDLDPLIKSTKTNIVVRAKIQDIAVNKFEKQLVLHQRKRQFFKRLPTTTMLAARESPLSGGDDSSGRRSGDGELLSISLDDEFCQCPHAQPSSKPHLIFAKEIVGRNGERKLQATLVMPWKTRNKAVRRAFKLTRAQKTICQRPLDAQAASIQGNNDESDIEAKRQRRSRKDRRRQRARNRP